MFKLGSSSGDGGAPKILSPQEAREARLKALEKSMETSKIKISEEKVKVKKIENPKKPRILSSQEVEMKARSDRFKQLQAEKMKARMEKIMLIKNFKADRGDF